MKEGAADEDGIEALEAMLRAAQERLRVIMESSRANYSSAAVEAYWAAQGDLIAIERRVAAAKGEEYAEPLDFPVQWDAGAPMPHLLANDRRTFLTFYVRVVDPAWDGTSVTVREPANPAAEPLALVEFDRCVSAKLGAPNDEVFHGHPLHGKGMDGGYVAQVVRNSRWLAELEAINSVHHGYRGHAWRELNHYVFWFHDNTFECVARSFKLELHHCSMSELLAEVCRRLVR